MTADTQKNAIKWYYKPVGILVLILAAGPFAIPFVWLSPALKKWHKIVIIAVLAVATIWLVKATVSIYRNLLAQMAQLTDAYNY
ncbi:MAG: hypothetical protein PHX20_05320 [Candidatus Omnitrophica bacterium]|nr:hypothetical protein [Candidatus Omnitrophota bacterium]